VLRRRSKSIKVGLLALVAAVPVGVAAIQPASADPAFSVTTLHFLTHTGPAGTQACDVIGDLYVPSDASPTHRVPAILTTNGFGGSKDDQVGIGNAFAARDYIVLSYSGLGFGGSGCRITLDDPDFDGKAASDLVSYLGGAPGIAFTDAAHTTPAPTLDSVVHDVTDHSGAHDTYDPRVGMIGGSYGGGIQFATAADDPRLDTIVPIITWSDLSYSLDPNNANQGVGVTNSTPGAVKLTWGLFLTADGLISAVQHIQTDPARLLGCPDFAAFVCPALVQGGTEGFFDPASVAAFRHASVASYMSKIKIPVLLMQGENDTLFNLNEAIANYQALRAQHTPVTMIWQSWGHSKSTPAPGELDLGSPDPATQYETARVADWFQHYLNDSPVSTGPNFAYFRDWVSYSGIATPAYATATAYPLASGSAHLYLSGHGQLVNSPLQVKAGLQTFLTPPAGLPTNLTDFDAIGDMFPLPDKNLPGTYAAWQGPALTSPLTVVGMPTMKLKVSAPVSALSQATGPAGQLVLFAKIYDVAPDGTASLINGLVAPMRVANVNAVINVRLPAIVHRFAAGHHVEIMVAGGDLNYRGGLVANPVTIASGAGQVLTLPLGS